MNNLDQRDSRQRFVQRMVRTGRKAIANLDAVGAAGTLLLDDFVDILARRKEKSRDWRWNRGRYLRDQFVADHARTARHLRDQTQRGSTECNGLLGFVFAGNTADLYSWPVGAIHAAVTRRRGPRCFLLASRARDTSGPRLVCGRTSRSHGLRS